VLGERIARKEGRRLFAAQRTAGYYAQKVTLTLFGQRGEPAMFRVSTTLCLAAVCGLFALRPLAADEPEAKSPPIRAGIIGLDAHGLPWTRILNNPEAEGELAEMRVVAAYPGGSPDIPQSMEILDRSVEPVRKLGVEIVDSIEALLPKVDAVLLLSIDGRVHLEQARPVIAAGKPLFVDKPAAGSLADAIRLFSLAEKASVPCFSSSSLRFAPGTQAVLSDPKVGDILACDAFSPAKIEPHHPDFFWYGIHGVETLFTIMGTGCKEVRRTHAEQMDVAVGLWDDGRIGTFRGTRIGPHTYGATVFGAKGEVASGRFEGYEPLLVEIVKFFKTGEPPVPHETTLEILAFMEAADRSKQKGGCPVSIAEVMKRAEAGAAEAE
jgi:predicted dehydrogenase